MDESQAAFNSQYQTGYDAFDLDMMKRSLEAAGGPEAKKARWSPNSFAQASSPNGIVQGAGGARDPFANYGYGPNANLGFSNGSSNGFAGAGNASALYTTPQLTLNTNMTNLAPGTVAQGQMSPTSATAAFSPQSAQTQQGMFSPYNMLGMGLPAMMGFPYGGQVANGNFASSPITPQRLPSLNIPAASTYTAGALSAALSATAANATNRTVYIGNLPPTASVDELLNLVHFGPLENIRVLPEKSCVFLSFLDGATAAAFHADATIKKLALHGQELKIGWGKPSPVPQQVALAISQSNASRNVYLGGLEESMTEEQLRDDLSRFGLIDQVKIVRDKNIGFVHFLSIATATKVVNTLPTEPQWAGKRVNYGKDRCAYIPKSQQAAAQSAQVAAAQSLMAQSAAAAAALSPASATVGASPFSPYAAFSPIEGANGLSSAGGAAAAAQGLNRTVYLGNIHPETTIEDLCNAIRGGVLQSIRYMQDKHIAFVTFIDPAAAFTFFQVASYQGLTLNNRRLKIGWGKNSGPLPPSLALSVHGGATRNVYVGNIEDFASFSEDKLKRDFGEFGEIELVNFLKEKNCAFVNFTNIANAIKAIDGVKNHPDYANLRIAHGKDRCANPPRQGPQGGGTRRNASSNGGAGPLSAGVSPGADGFEGSDAIILGSGDEGTGLPAKPEAEE